MDSEQSILWIRQRTLCVRVCVYIKILHVQWNEMAFTGLLCECEHTTVAVCFYFDIYFVIDFDLFNKLNLTIYKIIHCVYGKKEKEKKKGRDERRIEKAKICPRTHTICE